MAFTLNDFQAYAPHKWASNVFNRERLVVRQKLDDLARSVAAELQSAEGIPLSYELSVEHPALWNHHRVDRQQLIFCRDKRNRDEIEALVMRGRPMSALIEDPSPLRHQIGLLVAVNAEGLEVGLVLRGEASVDRSYFQHHCQDFFHRERVLRALQGLSEGFSVSSPAASEPRSARAIDDEHLQRLAQSLNEPSAVFSVMTKIAHDKVVGHDVAITEVLRGLLRELQPLFQEIAWRRGTHTSEVTERLREQEVKQRVRGLSKQDRVRIIRGVFQGKSGVVQGTDAKGAIKVLVGTLAVKLASEDVVKV